MSKQQYYIPKLGAICVRGSRNILNRIFLTVFNGLAKSDPDSSGLNDRFFHELLLWLIERCPSQFFLFRVRAVFGIYFSGKSISYRTIGSLLKKHKSTDVFVFDVFDTIISRTVHPEFVKDAVSDYLFDILNVTGKHYKKISRRTLREERLKTEIKIGNESIACGMDAESPLHEVLSRWISPYVKSEQLESVVQKLYDYEINIEKSCQYIQPEIRAFLSALKDANKKIYFLSDIYLTSSDLAALLEYHGLGDIFDGGIVSSEYMLTKRSGRLFDIAIEKFELDCANTVYIGDNRYVDFENARTHGLLSYLLFDISQIKRLAIIRYIYKRVQEHSYWRGLLFGFLLRVDFENVVGERESNGDRLLGRAVGHMAVGYMLSVIEKVRAEKISNVFALSREGYFLVDIYERIRTRLIASDLPKIVPLACSRLATNLPSYNRLSLENLARMWRQYPGQSFETICNNLSIDYKEFRDIANEMDFDMSRPIVDLLYDQQLCDFLEDQRIQDIFSRNKRLYNECFRSYLKSVGFPFDQKEKVLLLDVGWKGTIQDNISRFIKYESGCCTVEGLYIGFLNPGFVKDSKKNKSGYYIDGLCTTFSERIFLETNFLMELILSSDKESTLSYRDIRKGGCGLKNSRNIQEKILFWEHTQFAQQGVFDVVDSFARQPILHYFSSEDIRFFLLEQWRIFSFYPSLKQVNSIEKYYHFENFGVHEKTHISRRIPIFRILTSVSPWRWGGELRRYRNQILWMGMYLRKTFGFFGYVVNFIRECSLYRKFRYKGN